MCTIHFMLNFLFPSYISPGSIYSQNSFLFQFFSFWLNKMATHWLLIEFWPLSMNIVLRLSISFLILSKNGSNQSSPHQHLLLRILFHFNQYYFIRFFCLLIENPFHFTGKIWREKKIDKRRNKKKELEYKSSSLLVIYWSIFDM